MRFGALEQLCASRADLIVNMDTYQDAPFNASAFDAAVGWYTAHGCPPERTAVGLLVGEATDAEAAAAVLAAARATGAKEIDLWANLWGQAAALDAWRAPLQGFLASEPAGCTDGVALPWLCVPVWGVAAAAGGACALLTAAAAALAVRRRRRAQRRREEALLPNEAD